MQRFIYWLPLLLGLGFNSVQAQQHHYSWKIGLHGGMSQYYGDLSERVFDLSAHLPESGFQDLNVLSYGLSVEHHFTRSFGLRLMGTKNQFRASDRRYSDATNYERALNVQTDIWDVSLLGIWYTDTDALLGRRAIVSPYLLFGVGASYFTPRGDLLDANGDRYYYWSDNTIRNQDQTGSNANASIVERDYVYETDLAPLQTEGRRYDPITWNAALGLGLKWRLSRKVYVHFEGIVRYTGTDYLDDVAGDYGSYNDPFQAYAANPSGDVRAQRGSSPEYNDWYAQGFIGIHYSFGQNTHPIQPAFFYTHSLPPADSYTPAPETTATPSTTTTAPVAPAQQSRTSRSDTVRTVVTTTTTTITTTTVDSFKSGSKTTPVLQPAQPKGPSLNQKEPNDGIDSLFYVNLLDDFEQTIDSVFEMTYRANNPMPAWMPNTNTYAVQTDTVPVEQPTDQQIPTPKVNQVLNDSVERIAPSVGLVRVEPNAAPQPMSRTSYDSLLQAYRYEMELERERYKNELQAMQERANYERQLQAKEQELTRMRDSLRWYGYNKAVPLPPPTPKEQPVTVQPIPDQQDVLQTRIQSLEEQMSRLRQAPTSDSSAQAELTQLRSQLAAQQTELQQLRQVQQRDSTALLLAQLQDQQRELATLQQQLEANRAAAPSNGASGTSAADQRLAQQLQEQQRELESLRTALLVQTAAPPAPDQRSAELERLQQRLQSQEATIEQLRRDANQPAPPNVVTVPVPITRTVTPEDYDPQELERLRAEEIALQQRIAALEQGPAPRPERDTVRIVQTTADPAQAALIDSLQRQLAQVSDERRQLSGTLQEFLERKKPTHITKIYFDLGRSTLTPQAKETLTTLTDYLRAYPEVRFTVRGYASKTGSRTVNERLSVERAATVANYLETLGVSRARMSHTGMGELDTPLVDDLDRRAEVHLRFP